MTATTERPQPEFDMESVESGREDTGKGRPAWLGLLVQPVAIIVVAIVLIIWLTTANLSDVEKQTLAPGALWPLVVQHIQLTFMAALIVLVIAVPIGVLLTRGPFRKIAGVVVAIANLGQAAPAIGLVVLFAAIIGVGYWTAIIGLVIYGILPVLRNTMVGINQVDERLVEGGRGMGMSNVSVLMRIELPLAIPIMLTGIRTALVLLVGTATLAAFIDGGGLGLLIITGVNLFLPQVLVAGAIIVALLALVIDWLGRVFEYFFTPKGLS